MFGARVSFIFSSWAVVLGTGLLFEHGSFFFVLCFYETSHVVGVQMEYCLRGGPGKGGQTKQGGMAGLMTTMAIG